MTKKNETEKLTDEVTEEVEASKLPTEPTPVPPPAPTFSEEQPPPPDAGDPAPLPSIGRIVLFRDDVTVGFEAITEEKEMPTEPHGKLEVQTVTVGERPIVESVMRPAIVTAVLNGRTVALHVFDPSGVGIHLGVVYGTGPSQWSWPPQV